MVAGRGPWPYQGWPVHHELGLKQPTLAGGIVDLLPLSGASPGGSPGPAPFEPLALVDVDARRGRRTSIPSKANYVLRDASELMEGIFGS